MGYQYFMCNNHRKQRLILNEKYQYASDPCKMLEKGSMTERVQTGFHVFLAIDGMKIWW